MKNRQHGTSRFCYVNTSNGFGYVPFRDSSAVVCDDATAIPVVKREFEYSYKYTYNATLRYDSEILSQVTRQWVDENKLMELHQQCYLVGRGDLTLLMSKQ